ncbi:LysR family transcriptional regulator [Marinomonas transparens]|uniref:LysR family transcriptional regulator n=1 Tax=Marinomonas transparens TaxID=2795388 RepID=A0A934JTV8_9GAMM|nr:LysR family transcriptional regulator [Marinomonas transparens]MBJ7537275.1 LysR family transcriptional regulator [Marinomonas transparens]
MTIKIDLNILPVFIAVVEEHNFRAAADRLGITRSAVSQMIRKLEDQLGIALFTRTTRSVKLTEAGEHLFSQVHTQLDNVHSSLENVASHKTPRGLLKIAATSIAEPFLSGQFIVEFSKKHPEIELDITVTDDEFDIVKAGFDAGVRLGDSLEQDMVALPISGLQRDMVVASPDYLIQHGKPNHPKDLLSHRCIGWRPKLNSSPYYWEFNENGKGFDVSVEPQITTNDIRLMLRVALAGGGITFATEEVFQPYIKVGTLIPLLEEFLPTFSGFYFFYPNRENMAPKLRAMVNFVKTWEQT